MSFFDGLLLFGLPLGAYFAFLMWSSNRKQAHQSRHHPRRSGMIAPPAPIAPVAASVPTAAQLKLQQEIAALQRLGDMGRPSLPPAAELGPSEARRNAYNLPARWAIRYIDAYGEVTDRIIEVQHLSLRHMAVEAYCETRRAERTFRLRNMQRVTDPRTGAPVNVRDYVERVRAGRRSRR